MTSNREIIELPPIPPPPKITNDVRFNLERQIIRDVLDDFYKITAKNFTFFKETLKSLIIGAHCRAEIFMLHVKIYGENVELSRMTIDKIVTDALKLNYSPEFFIFLIEYNQKFQIYWRSNDQVTYILQINEDQQEISKFVIDFLVNSMKIYNHCGVSSCISSMSKSTSNICELDLTSLADDREFNLLMIAAENGDEIATNYLLNVGFDVNTTALELKPVDIAWNNGHFDIVVNLLRANSMYPKNFNFAQSTDQLMHFYETTKIDSSLIKYVRIDDILKIVERNSNLRHFYTTSNQSVLVRAILYDQTELYRILVSKNLFIGPSESINSILKSLNYSKRELLRGLNLQTLQKLTEDHITILMTNSFVGGCNVPDVNQKYDLVRNAFQFLDNLGEAIALILKVVAASHDFQIIFDFHRECIQHLDPTSYENTRGVYHTSKHIYVAAKNLLNLGRRLEVYGTLAHEMCHYAMHLVYHNGCKPYFEGNEDQYRRFRDILKACFHRRSMELLINVIYENYNEDVKVAELIVRVPHMIVEYSSNETKLIENRQAFPSLFYFYENVVVEDMKKSIRTTKAVNDEIIKKFEDRIKKKKQKINFLWILCAFMLTSIPFFVWVGIFARDSIINRNYDCSRLTSVDKEIIFNSTVNFIDVDVIFSDLFGSDADVCDILTNDQVNNILKSKEISFHNIYRSFLQDTASDDYLNYLVNRTKFGSESTKIMDKYVNHDFQTCYIKIATINKDDIFEALNRRFIPEITSNHSIILISGDPGSGKSTILRNIRRKLKRKLPLIWVSYVDLNYHYEILQNFTYNKTDINDFLARKIFRLSIKNDLRIFNDKFTKNESIFFWDNIDDLDKNSISKAVKIIQQISEVTDNQQWVAIRSSQKHLMYSIEKVTVHELSIITSDERRSFILKFMNDSGILEESRRDDIFQKVEKIVSVLEKAKSLNKEMIKTSQVLNMICEIVHQNNSDQNFSNVYSVFEFYVRNLVLSFSQKSSTDFLKNHQNSSIDSLKYTRKNFQNESKIDNKALWNYLYYSSIYKVLHSKNFTDDFSNRSLSLTELKIGIFSSKLDEEVLSIFKSIIKEKPFSDRIIQEFLVAQYFVDNLLECENSKDSEETDLNLRLLFFIMKENKRVVVNFINEAVEKFCKDVKDVVMKNFRNIKDHCKEHAQSMKLILKFLK